MPRKDERPDAIALDGRPEFADALRYEPKREPHAGASRPSPRRRTARDLEKKASMAREALGALLEPSGHVKRGSVIGDLLYRSSEGNVRPDGFPTSSRSASPALERSASQHGLRSSPSDALRRKREPGFAGSSVEDIVIAREEEACEECEGKGETWTGAWDTTDPPTRAMVACAKCGGSGSKYRDVQGEAIEAIWTALEVIVVQAHIISKKRQIVVHAGDAAAREERVANCDGCHRKVYGGRSDPIRRGLCNACATRYYTWRINNGTNDEPSDRRRFNEQRDRHEGHLEGACDACADLRRRAADDWRLDVGHGMKTA